MCSGYDLLLSFLSFYKLLASRANELLVRHTILPFSRKPGTCDKALKTSAMEANKLPSCFEKTVYSKTSSTHVQFGAPSESLR